jgi:hypothetical protein
MSESDTYLDSILEGMTIEEAARKASGKIPNAPAKEGPPKEEAEAPKEPGDEASAQEKAPQAQSPPEASSKEAAKRGGIDLDALIDDLTAPRPSGASTPEGPEVADPALVGTLPQADPSDLLGPGAPNDNGTSVTDQPPVAEPETTRIQVASPQDILGVPSQPGDAGSHIELAHEVNAVAAGEAPTEQRTVWGERARAVSEQGQKPEDRWHATHSLAAIARDLSDTADTRAAAETQGQKSEQAERPIYVNTKRRRRKRRVNRGTVAQVVALFLLLVVGLAGEYEYVAKHASNSETLNTTPPPVPAPRLPTVVQTPRAGTVFHFAALGTAESAPFKVSSRSFVVAWTARCTRVSSSSVVGIAIQSGGRNVTSIYVPIRNSALQHGTTTTKLGPGTYVLIAHTSIGCTWSAEGQARA